jgi:ubiquinone biosynthesis protein
LKALLKLLVTPAARRALRGSLRPAEVAPALRATWRIYDQIVPSIPKESTWGGRLMVRLAACAISLYRALLRMNVPGEEAARLVSTAAWLVYEKMALAPRVLAALVARDPLRRLRIATDLFRWFPFGPPSYRMADVPAEAGVVAFDVLRCPVAEFFRQEGHPELCVRTFCDLDFPLARSWGASLERTGTLAGGAGRCDFRWRTPPRARARRRAEQRPPEVTLDGKKAKLVDLKEDFSVKVAIDDKFVRTKIEAKSKEKGSTSGVPGHEHRS